MKNQFRKVIAAIRADGISALPREIARIVRRIVPGIRWRARKVRWAIKRRVRGTARRGVTAIARRSGLMRGLLPGNVANLPMASDASIAKAEATLKALQVPASTRAAAPEQLPDLSVAVIVPTFRDGEFLRATLESVRAQTHTNLKCYIVDDASPDDVGAIVAKFTKEDPRFVYVRHGANAGLSAARNTGLRIATEDLVLFLDADDLLPPAAIEVRVAAMAANWHLPYVAGAYGQIVQTTEEVKLSDLATWSRQVSLNTVAWHTTNGECPFNVHAPLTRRSVAVALGGFDEAFLNGAEDWDLWQRILRHGFTFEPVNAVVGAYRQRSSSMVREHPGIHLRRASALLDLAEQQVSIDPAVAVGDASAPLGQAIVGQARARRAAQRAGLEAAAHSKQPPYFDADALEFVGGAALPSAWDDYRAAARGGIVRGLCLSPFVLSKLSIAAQDRIEALAKAVADELVGHATTAAHIDGTDILRRRTADVALVPETIADTELMRSIAADLQAAGLSVVMANLDAAKGNEGVASGLAGCDLPMVSYNEFVLGQCAPKLVLSRREVGPVTIDLLHRAASWGGRAAVLAEADRELLVPESPATPFPAVAAGDVPSFLAAPAVAPSAPIARFEFSALLPKEESGLDPVGSERLLAMKDKFKGETAVIIGNGPSLNQTDLSLLSKARTFGVNSIFLADDRLPERLTFYTVEDTAVFKDNTEAVKAYQADYRFFPVIYRPSFEQHEITDNVMFFRMNGGFYGRGTGTECHPRFSLDASQRLYCGQSVTIINLQLAHWMGFQRVVLIGMDFSYTIPDDADRKGDVIVSRSDDPNHFHPGYFGAGKTWKDPKLDRVLINYRLAGEVYRATGREIINATVGGKLEVFPRMTLADALG